MSRNESLNLLIAKAGVIAGSEYKLAKAMGVPQTHLSMWKAGTKTCTPPDRARLAGFAKEDAVQELVRATLEQTAGTLRGDQLKQVLGKLSRATGGALHSVIAGVAALTFAAQMFDIPRCIKSQIAKRRFRLC